MAVQTMAVEDRLCVALYEASHAMSAAYRDLLDPLGLTYPQYTVMSALWQDGPATVTAIGRRLGLESSTTSPLIKRLEQLDLVRRRRDIDDERSVVVELTTAGRALRARARGVQGRISAATDLSEQEQQALVDQLRQLTDTLRAG